MGETKAKQVSGLENEALSEANQKQNPVGIEWVGQVHMSAGLQS